jgi:hypothetical protein
MITLEYSHTYKTSKQCEQPNDAFTDTYNPIFDTIIQLNK